MGIIRTVLGDISPEDFGPALVHEHILVDSNPSNGVNEYDPEEVFEIMFPYLIEIRDLGIRGFVECSTAYMGRDVRILKKLSKTTGIHILANTGFFLEPYIPKYAFEYSIEDIANEWIKEINEGIDGTDVKAGFIKIAIEPGKMKEIYVKTVKAAAQCSLSTGAVIACHMESGKVAMIVLDILEKEGLNGDRLIFVHADSEEVLDYHLKAASRGVWIEYDRVNQQTSERTLKLIEFMVRNGFEDKILLSQDSGWYSVGQPSGGNIRGYGYLVRDFLPLMLKRGFSQDLINRIIVDNPAKAFQMEKL
ncbi:MAG: aryldialkylphosphatase [Thermoproteota archaeon]